MGDAPLTVDVLGHSQGLVHHQAAARKIIDQCRQEAYEQLQRRGL